MSNNYSTQHPFQWQSDFRYPQDVYSILTAISLFCLTHLFLLKFILRPLALRCLPDLKPLAVIDEKKIDVVPSVESTSAVTTITDPTKLTPPPSPILKPSSDTDKQQTNQQQKQKQKPQQKHHDDSAETEIADREMRIRKFITAGFKLIAYATLFGYGLYSLLLDDQIYAASKSMSGSAADSTQESSNYGWLWNGGVSVNYGDWPAVSLHDIPIGTTTTPTSTGNDYDNNVNDGTTATKKIITTDSPILNHYLLAIAHYGYATLLVLFDLEGVRQKDKWEMTLHHLVTLSLIGFSWHWKLFRAGALILVLHDFSDPLMEVAKLMLYTGRQTAANIWFALFATSFIISRCVVFPAIIIYPSMSYLFSEDGQRKASMVGYIWLPVAGLFILQALHIFWSSIIVKMVIDTLREGNVGSDVRDEE